MAAEVTLERFDKIGRDRPAVSQTESAAAAAQQSSLPSPTAPEDILDPMPVHPSPEQEKTVELQRGLEVLQRKLAQIVQSIDGELRAAKGQITSQAAGAIAASATTLLPSLLDEGFAQELSSATLQIATAVEPDQIALRVHPDDHDPIVDALHSLAPPSPVTIEKDGGLRPGSVRLSWSNGGAEMNREALLNNARDLLEARLASIVSGRNQDDHRIQY